jgi:hypothetical protein
MNYPIRQCAWCHRVADSNGQYGIVAARKMNSATHGICPGCKEQVRAEFDRSRNVRVAQAA